MPPLPLPDMFTDQAAKAERFCSEGVGPFSSLSEDVSEGFSSPSDRLLELQRPLRAEPEPAPYVPGRGLASERCSNG